MVLPKIPAAPALFIGSAAALLLGVAAAGLLGPTKPVKVFSEDTEMSATGRLMQIAVAPPPKTVIAPPTGKLPTMPENLAETPMFHSALAAPPVTPVPAPQPRRRAEPEVIYEEEVEVELDYARAAPRWREVPADDDGYYDDRSYREARRRYEGYGNRRDDGYGERGYARRYDDRYAAAPPYYAQPYYAEPRYEYRWGR